MNILTASKNGLKSTLRTSWSRELLKLLVELPTFLRSPNLHIELSFTNKLRSIIIIINILNI